MRPGIASSVKAALLGSILVALWMMWGARDFVTDAYQQTPNTLELRLGGIDLAVTRSEVDESPFAIPAAPDTRRRPLPAVGLSVQDLLEDTPPVEMSGGTSRLRGTVVGPEGPVDQAVVAMERHTSHGIGQLRVTTTADGRWSADGVPGGRYRVRAWVPGLMTVDRSQVVFVGEHEVADFGFSLWGVDQEPSMEFVHGGPIHDGLTGTVAIVMSRQSIDQDGFVVTAPVVGASVSIAVSADMSLASSATRVTDEQGAARFVVACVPSPSPSPSPPSTGTTANPASGPTAPDSGSSAAPDSGLVRGSATGTLSARSGSLVENFPLPGCIPVPTAEIQPPPVDGDPAGPGNTGQAGGDTDG